MEQISITKQEQAMQAIASDDTTRFNINGVYFNSKHIVATNGHALALRKKSESQKLENALVEFKNPKLKGKGPDAETYNLISNGLGQYVGNNPANVINSVTNEITYPDYKAVLPEKLGSIEICLDVHLLMKLATALDINNGKSAFVRIVVNPDNLTAPMIVAGETPSQELGILMPIRLKNPEEINLANWKE